MANRGYSPAGDSAGEEGEEEATEGDPDPSPPADDSEFVPTEEELRNPQVKRLSDQAARYRTSAKAEKERADAAEAKANQATEAMRTLALRTGFNEAARKAAVEDVDAAWKLAADEVKGLTFAEDGAVDDRRLHDIVRTVTRRHPGLLDTPDEGGAENLLPSGRPTNGRRRTGDAGTAAALAKKFPALRRK